MSDMIAEFEVPDCLACLAKHAQRRRGKVIQKSSVNLDQHPLNLLHRDPCLDFSLVGPVFKEWDRIGCIDCSGNQVMGSCASL